MTISYDGQTTKSTRNELPKVHQGNYNQMMNAIISETDKFGPRLQDLEEDVKKFHDEHKVQFDKLDTQLRN